MGSKSINADLSRTTPDPVQRARLWHGSHRGATRRARGRSSRPSGEFRPDIQGLRAAAVGLVVVYHLYPGRLTGGYVGVDVFFVISGFLITGHLASALRRDGRVRLLDFYGRRARRLMPAAALVLAVTWLAARWLLPVTQLPQTAAQVRASALYFQNWELARGAVSYLRSTDPPTPVQHFWSLSVEEQFYLVWPALFLVAAAVGAIVTRRRPTSRDGRFNASTSAVLLVLAVAVFAVSLWYSVRETDANPAAAYFVTPTRMWELAAGGVLALLRGRAARLLARAGLLSWVGLALILWSAFSVNDDSAFPGWLALLPVGGALLVLGCGGPDGRFGTARLASLRPAVFFGDISYSLYLWHWPVIVLWRAYSGSNSIGILDGPAIVVVSSLLAWLTKVLVEDRVRLSPLITGKPWRSLATVSAVVVPVVLASVWIAGQPGPYKTAVADEHHSGAKALAASTPPARSAAIVPPLTAAATDYQVASGDDCQASRPAVAIKKCVFGDTVHPTKTVGLVGDSVAGVWSSVLARIAKREHWKLVVITHSTCPWTSTMMTMTGHSKPFTACARWGAAVLTYLTDTLKPDVVITTDRPTNGIPADPRRNSHTRAVIGAGMADYWRRLAKIGTKIIGIRETPEMGKNVPLCLGSRGKSAASCSTPAAKAIFRNTAIQVAAKKVPASKVIDMNSLICGPKTCAPVVGNVIVYRDSHHLTNTYTLTLEPYLQEKLLATGMFQGS